MDLFAFFSQPVEVASRKPPQAKLLDLQKRTDPTAKALLLQVM